MKWLALLLFVSCAQVTSLNMKKHQFGVLPTKIIWFQVAGLEEEHLAMLRFDRNAESKTTFENMGCMGKSWSYNLYDLRPTAESGFLSQMTGKKNIKQTCEDAELRPIWSYLTGNNNYSSGILEVGASDQQSLVSLNQCGEKGLVFLSNLHYWLKKAAPKNTQTYSSAEKILLTPNQFYYDRSCGPKLCSSTIYEDFKAIYPGFTNSSYRNLFIIRDFSYLAALEKKDFVRAKQILEDIERAFGMARDLTDKSSEYLVLLTTAASKYVDFPSQGKGWYEFEKLSSGAEVKRTKLTNLVIASGARAENFCGVYDDSQIFERILSGPKQQGLELMIINPFK
jgi:hypothetical protein